MFGRVKSIEEVVQRGLCSGCGVCSYLQPHDIRLIDRVDEGLRPQCVADPGAAIPAGEAIQACPGAGLAHEYDASDGSVMTQLLASWGPVRAIWEGHALDAELRFAGSSGGAASALALHGLEVEGYAGVLHSAARRDAPHLNETVLSHSRAELLARTGSRYAPASPADGLRKIEEARGPCLFIGKPCDVAAVQKARKLRPRLDRNLAVTIAFFCAGTPATLGTLQLLQSMAPPESGRLLQLRYRGNGWPGDATAIYRLANGARTTRRLSYEQSWGRVLSKYVQWRCRLCIDHSGEFADIAVGDPWYRPIVPGEPGSSLIVARTAKGEAFVRAATAARYLSMTPIDPGLLSASQPNLLRARGAVWGRLLALRLIGAAAPHYRRLPTFRFWLRELTLAEKAKSILGTIRRCLQRRLHPAQRARRAARMGQVARRA